MLQVDERLNRLIKSPKVARIIIIAITTIFFCTQIVSFFTISNNQETQPGLAKFPFHLALKAHYWFSGARHNSLVAIRYAGDSVIQVARVKALPGEEVKRQADYLIFASGEILQLRGKLKDRFKENFTLEPDRYFVVSGSSDSNQAPQIFGFVRAEKITGEVLW